LTGLGGSSPEQQSQDQNQAQIVSLPPLQIAPRENGCLPKERETMERRDTAKSLGTGGTG